MYSNVTPPALPDYNPVSGYSYNGVELPFLPSWNTSTYPYAVIYWSSYFSAFTLQLTSATAYYGPTDAGPYLLTKASGVSFSFYTAVDNSWVLKKSSYMSSRLSFCDFNSGDYCVWSNYDILYENDNSLFLASSEPVPVLAYPYSVMVYDYEKGAEDWYQVHLYYSATPFTWNGEAVGNSGTVYKRIYDAAYDGWTEEAETEIEASPGLTGTTYQRIYTDHDIKDSAGNIWLAAGSVTEAEKIVTETWLRSFQAGLAIGLAGKPLPIKKEPLAFVSRNGDTIILMGAYRATLTDGILEVV
jgi:hypothetical protein